MGSSVAHYGKLLKLQVPRHFFVPFQFSPSRRQVHHIQCCLDDLGSQAGEAFWGSILSDRIPRPWNRCSQAPTPAKLPRKLVFVSAKKDIGSQWQQSISMNNIVQPDFVNPLGQHTCNVSAQSNANPGAQVWRTTESSNVCKTSGLLTSEPVGFAPAWEEHRKAGESRDISFGNPLLIRPWRNEECNECKLCPT